MFAHNETFRDIFVVAVDEYTTFFLLACLASLNCRFSWRSSGDSNLTSERRCHIGGGGYINVTHSLHSELNLPFETVNVLCE